MPRPRGYRTSQAERDRIAASQREAWAERRPWVEASRNILAAANAGDRQLATDLLNDWMDAKHADVQNSLSPPPMLGREDIRAMLDGVRTEIDELAAETERVHAQHRERASYSAEDIANITGVLRNAVHGLVTQMNMIRKVQRMAYGPQSGQPRPTERARRLAAARNALQGEPLGDNATSHLPHDAASPVYVSPTQTRHEPTTARHTHDHGAHGHPDHDDGIHSHEHEHVGDADHNHSHDFGTLRPGRVGQTGQR